MGQLSSALAKAASVVFGTGAWHAGDAVGPLANNDAFATIFDPGVSRDIIDTLDAGDLYATQPHLRTVVSFVARNAAQLGRHIYSAGADGDRTRVTDSVAAKLLAKPNDYMSGYDLFNMLFSELALYDMAIWVPVYRDGRWQIDPIPGEWITGIKKASAFRTAGFRIKDPATLRDTFLPADQAIVFRGYSPHGFQRGSSAVRSLRGILSEQVASMNFRQQMWRRGGRVGMFMSRPATAPEWGPEAKAKFIQSWRNNWAGDGASAGSTPLLEDGMELKRVGFTSKEEQWLEAATLSLSTVAGSFHVPPAMVGVSGYNSFASVKEFRKMLYTETLGPGVAQVEDTVNNFLLPFIGEPASNFFELNIGEKLQGDFEEQANVLFQAVGGPYMAPNEARKKVNLPAIDGGDALLMPLNMGASGNSGPLAGEPIAPDPSGATGNGAPDVTPGKSRTETHPDRARDEHALGLKTPTHLEQADLDALETDLKSFFKRQQTALAGQVTAAGKADPSWWDHKHWNRELSAVLQPHMTTLSSGVAKRTAKSKGLRPEDYSVGRTTNFLKAVADSRANLINSTTRDNLIEAAKEPNIDEAVGHVFTVATESRASAATKTMGTMLTAWAVTEVVRQLVPDKRPRKTWIASGLPNSRHEDMDGETVPIDEAFSNGGMWPGDPVLGAGEVSNCGCEVDVSFDTE